MTEKLQNVLAMYFRDTATWRRNRGHWRYEDDARDACSAEWLENLAEFVEALPDDDPGIRTLTSFGWPAAAFRHGAGHESNYITRKIGFRGDPNRPLTVRPSRTELTKTWRYWVTNAERDREYIDRLVAILGAIADQVPQARRQSVLGRLARRQEAMSA